MKHASNIFLGALIPLLLLSALLVLPDTQVDSINEILLQFPGLDKFAHFIEHLCIVVVVYFGLGRFRKNISNEKKMILAFSCSVMFSLIDETHQLFISGRSFEITDLFSNTLGTLTGLTIVSYNKLQLHLFTLCVFFLLLAISLITYETYSRLQPYYTGMQLAKSGKLEQAREQYTLALKAGNKSGAVYNEIAWLDLEYLDRDPQIALEYAKKAVTINNRNPDFLETYGYALLKVGLVSDSLQYLLQAYELNPDIYCIHLHLGSAYLALGNTDKAIWHLRKQLEQDTDERFRNQANLLLQEINRSS